MRSTLHCLATALQFALLASLLSQSLRAEAGERYGEASKGSKYIDIWSGSRSNEPEVLLQPFLVKREAGDSAVGGRATIIICSGGSYLWHDKYAEGVKVAEWLNSRGIDAFILHYRTEGFVAAYSSFKRQRQYGYPGVLMDLKRAIYLLRAGADDFGINGKRIGVMGFSAGGHLALMAAHFQREESRVAPEGSAISLKPDFVAAIYPVVTMANEKLAHRRSRRVLLRNSSRSRERLDSLSMERNIPADHPPLFLVNCRDDNVVDYRNSQLLDSALTRNAIPHRYLLYEHGGHGFGADPNRLGEETGKWMEEFIDWLNTIYSGANENEFRFLEGEIQRGY